MCYTISVVYVKSTQCKQFNLRMGRARFHDQQTEVGTTSQSAGRQPAAFASVHYLSVLQAFVNQKLLNILRVTSVFLNYLSDKIGEQPYCINVGKILFNHNRKLQ